jgi:copper chaperone NosL
MSAVVSSHEPTAKKTARSVRTSHPDEHRGMRRTVAGLSVLGAALFFGSFFFPYWNYHLVAPQYPDGLDLVISLSGVSGDLAEIDILNHYIGMHSLEEAAKFERQIALYLVSAVSIVSLVWMFLAGKRWGWLTLIPAVGLPFGFMADTFAWMWWFGHDLDPKAPLNFDVFTPNIVGPGLVGQFQTWAWPAMGWWMAFAGLVSIGVALVLRRRICNDCAHAGSCGATCPRLLVLAPAKESR